MPRRPTMYNQREFIDVGGLISYGPSQSDAFRRGRIVEGEKPGDLPVELAATFELVINLATAKASLSRFRRRCLPAPTRNSSEKARVSQNVLTFKSIENRLL